MSEENRVQSGYVCHARAIYPPPSSTLGASPELLNGRDVLLSRQVVVCDLTSYGI